MTARVFQQAVEVVTDGDEDGGSVRLLQQTKEVASNAAPAVRLSQASIEVLNRPGPPTRLHQFCIEVLSSSLEGIFDPAVGFIGLEPAGEITERWSWVTDTQIARAGDQVRVSLRTEPRVQTEFTVLTTNASDMALIDALLTGWQARSYYLPVWQDRAKLGAPYAIGATTITTPLENFEYVDGGLIALWESPKAYQIVQVVDADPVTNTLALASPLTRAFPATAWIAPIRRAWLLPEASATRFTGAAFEARLVFNAEEPVPLDRIEWDRDDGGPYTVDSLSLFAHVPNWDTAPQHTYRRRLVTIGDETIRPWRYDPSGRGWITRSATHTLTSRAEINKFLSWAAERRGRARAYLAPVWDQAIEVTRPNTSTATALYVTSRDYEQMFTEIEGRGYIALQDATGWIVRRIVRAERAIDNPAEDVFTLNAAIGRAGTPGGWKVAVLAEPAQLSSDTLELRWWNSETVDVVVAHDQVIA